MKREQDMQKAIAARNEKPSEGHEFMTAIKREREIYRLIKFAKDDPEGFHEWGQILGEEPTEPLA